jgi:hypothetical protein
MITGLGKNSASAFNLLYLEEGEHYIQDFFGRVSFYDLTSSSYRVAQAIIHFSSRSLIIDIKDPNQPLYKYLLKNFAREPTLDRRVIQKKGEFPLKVNTSRIVEVPVYLPAPRPYILHEAKVSLK